MNFQQLVAMIPVLDQIGLSRANQTLEAVEHRHVLIIVLSGHLTITASDGDPAVVTQGYACHPLHGPFTLQVPKTKEAEYMVITYRVFPDNSAWTLQGPLRTLSEVKIKYMLDELVRTTDEIHTHSAEEEAAQQFRKRLILERMLFIFLYETHMTQEETASGVSIEESLSYMNEHYMLKLSLPMLAARAGMSEGHYTVLFKRHTGMTMTQYLRRLRIDKAKQMFQQTGLTAKEVSQRVGFADYFHFSRIFKQEAGCSPTAYQRSLQ
ncbi:helix-turn-helix domain-containing protein [Paenibacillus rigui]|uniref:AraC family transcriptional regulator n=1 Tax=Paenibacillus rigui TaxID=554312 RepID=A0A229UJZ5_9BACL|nr:AraC family transcriptional regulator [Paenibacillus rigui]OXM83624.1 AraC family transcriptional regulator [Paenibacillus rigui]